MKKNALLSALVLSFAVPVFAEEGDLEKSPASYIVTGTAVDPSLKNNESAFAFTFQTVNFAVTDSIQLSDNGKVMKIKPDRNGFALLPVISGKHKFQFFYNANFYEIYTDLIPVKPGYRTSVNVIFRSALIEVISDKPVIYVYPEKTKAVSISLDVKGTLSFSYPQYNSGWNFTADPDGTIHMNGKQYDYLFWDGQTTVNAATTKLENGFRVDKKDLVPFFENKLTAMGLSPRETEDFITYWCPRMMQNETNFVHFEFNAAYDAVSTMQITPKPDNLFRLYMIWGDAKLVAMPMQEQQLEKVKRSGFTVIEWGGTELKSIPQQTK